MFYVRRALWILIAWTIISNVLFLYEFFTLDSYDALDSTFDFKTAFEANLIVGICAGLIGGIFTVNVMEIWLRKFPFWRALLYIVFLYLAGALIVSTLGAFYFNADTLGKPWGHPETIAAVERFYTSFLFIKNFIVWLFIVLLTLIILMINDKYGPGVFPDYLMGRYFLPKNETRIFMFADIRNATGIAEDLGEKRYFNFLKDFFNDIAPAIMQTRGEVYQYVGDEVVITWKMRNGILNSNSLRCYYRMRKIIAQKSEKYLKKYNAIPHFKVGLHCGQVMVGEIGKIKRDIAFSGDVLNTTARIQAACNDKSVDILASKNYADKLYKLPKGIRKVPLGEELLKGKTEQVALVTFERGFLTGAG